MTTKAGVGYSTSRNPAEAGREAARKALLQAGIKVPDLVLVYATIGYDQQSLIDAIREETSRAPLCGCSGEGIITGNYINESNFAVSVMVIRSGQLRFHVTHAGKRPDSYDSGKALAGQLMPQIAEDSFACFVFPDGLAFNFDRFKAGYESIAVTREMPPLFGGLSSDNSSLSSTYQYFNGEVMIGGTSCFLISGAGSVAWAINHGCVPVGTRHIITKSRSNRIYEIDGIPALELLSDYLEEGWRENWNKATLNLCLGFSSPERIRDDYGDFIIRYLISKNDRDGSVCIQSDAPEGAELWIVRRDQELICRGSELLTDQFRQRIDGRKPKFILHFDCVGRGKLVFREQERLDLLNGIQDRIGVHIPWIGFYTYGEIGPVCGVNSSHNFTAVLVAVC